MTVNANFRNTDPDTSEDAAKRDPEQRQRDRDRALAALRAAPDGLTDYELAAIIGRQQNSAGKRRGELRDAGLVRDSGRRRPAPSGSSAIVWEAVPLAELKPPTPPQPAREPEQGDLL